jgi:hypothetical protein
VEALSGGARTEYANPDADGGGHRGRRGPDRNEPAGPRPTTLTPSHIDARSQRRGRFDLSRSAPRERDRPLLLGEPVGELRRRRDSRLECGTTLRRQRPVGKRRQLGELLTAVLVSWTTSQRHGNTIGDSGLTP